jgi:phosphate-selective porin OprO/OprP
VQIAVQLLRSLSAAALAAAFTVSPAWAEKSLEELLVEKGVISAADLEALDDRDEDEEPAEAAEPGGKDEWNDLVEISVNYKGLAVKSRDDQFVFAFGGRIQLDGTVFVQDKTSMGDGTEFRRGRIKSFGTLWKDWDYKLEVNFDPDLSVPVTDGWLRYSGFKPFTVTVGHQKVPFSQQSMTSSNWQVFQERGLPDTFIDNEEQGRRRLGVVAAMYGKYWSYAGGVFSGGLGSSGSTNEDFGTGHRLVFQAIAEKTRVFAVGASVIYRDFNGTSDLRFEQRPEVHLGRKLLDTGTLATAQDIVAYNFEATGVWGPWHAQAEYTAARVWQGRGNSNLDFDGFYVQGGVFLTGESRNYDAKSAKYKRPMPESKWGAWELAARFSQLDLTNSGVRGGVERDFTAGVNWWANRNVMFRLNYVYGDLSPNSGVAHGGQNENVHAFSARAQVVF